MTNKKSVAIIGGGVSGIVAAHKLQESFAVTIFESNDYLGGHTSTIDVKEANRTVPVDTGFIVLNNHTYPNFTKFLDEISVPIRFADMSFAFENETSGFAYSGKGVNGLLAQRKNLFSPAFWQLILGIGKFSKAATSALENQSFNGRTLGEFLADEKISNAVIRQYVLPVGASIWSTPAELMLKYPAETFINFFKNHGLLSIKDRPRWQTVVGGSNSYVKKFKSIFNGDIVLNAKVSDLKRENDSVSFKVNDELQSFDQVIIATHADSVLGILADPSTEESTNFSIWKYNKNHTVLHTDESVMPKERRAWAAWNYLAKHSENDQKLSVTYWMNLLQGIESSSEYFVTLNTAKEISPDKIIKEFDYMHPVYTNESLATQSKIKVLSGTNNTFYAGSYLGYGFHEDAVTAGLEAGNKLMKQVN